MSDVNIRIGAPNLELLLELANHDDRRTVRMWDVSIPRVAPRKVLDEPYTFLGIEPQAWVQPPFLALGLDTRVLLVRPGRGLLETSLGSPFYSFVASPDERTLTVIHETGVLAWCDGLDNPPTWTFVATEVVASWDATPDALELVTDDGTRKILGWNRGLRAPIEK